MGEMHEIWRQAALDDRPQFRGPVLTNHEEWLLIPPHPNEQCAMTILPPYLLPLDEFNGGNVRCLVEECDWVLWSMTSLIIHLNNHHQWTWLEFANKFPEPAL